MSCLTVRFLSPAFLTFVSVVCSIHHSVRFCEVKKAANSFKVTTFVSVTVFALFYCIDGTGSANRWQRQGRPSCTKLRCQVVAAYRRIVDSCAQLKHAAVLHERIQVCSLKWIQPTANHGLHNHATKQQCSNARDTLTLWWHFWFCLENKLRRFGDLFW